MKHRLATLLLLLFSITASAQTKAQYQKLVDSFSTTGQTAKLIPYFEAELKKRPKNEEVLGWLGILYFNADKPDAAEKYYRQAIAINPKCARCYANLGRLYGMQKDFAKAETFINKSIALDTTDALLYATRANLREMKGEKMDALFDYNRAVTLAPREATYFIQRGNFNAAQGDFYLALSDYNAAVALAPKSYYPLQQRAAIYYDRRMTKEALADVNAALLLDSSQASLYTGRGGIFSDQREYAKAIADYDRAITLDPTDYSLYFYRSQQKYAMEDMDGFCSDLHNGREALLKRAPTDSLKMQFDDAIAVYCDPAKASYYYQRGVALFNRSAYDKAVDMYTAGLQKFPTNSMTLSFRGNAWFAKGAYQKALDDYLASDKERQNLAADIELNQKHSNLTGKARAKYAAGFLATNQVGIAKCLFGLGRYEEALTAINTALEMAPDIKEYGRENYYNVQGNIYLALGNSTEAKADFDRCVAINPMFAPGYINRALTAVTTASQVKMRSLTISSNGGSSKAQNFNANWTLPVKASVKKSEAGMSAALADCNRAIGIDATSGYAFYVRGLVKKSMGRGDQCADLLQSKKLGYPVDIEVLAECR